LGQRGGPASTVNLPLVVGERALLWVVGMLTIDCSAGAARRGLWVLGSLAAAFFAAGVCCGPAAAKGFGPTMVAGDDAGDGAPAGVEPVEVTEGPPQVGSSAGDATTAAPVEPMRTAETPPSDDDAALDAGGDDGGGAVLSGDGPPAGACTQPLAPGDLAIDEIMLESVAGTGDYGQWFEVENTLGCAIDLRGLHGECPKASKVVTFDVSDDLWIPPYGFFVVADSVDPTVNHDLPGTVIAWLGSPGDALRKDGTTITLSVAGTVIEAFTYPKLSLTVGASLEFPSDCDGGLLGNFSSWQTATSSWFPSFFGTPNAPNSDVSCQ